MNLIINFNDGKAVKTFLDIENYMISGNYLIVIEKAPENVTTTNVFNLNNILNFTSSIKKW
jgi:hypothetical protein